MQMMNLKVFIALACICAVVAQRNNFNRRQNQIQNQGRVAIDHRDGGSEYHYSWRHDGGKWEWNQANAYCRRLGQGWQLISINNGREFGLVDSALRGESQPYIWTSGQGRNGRFGYGDGSAVTFGWSHTGGNNRPQPDNREGNEFCVATLNNFYRDGTKLHDVACHHLKPAICERKAG
ncbi:hypothetical protein Avbf_09707 [Armadillidium vulgare]|nr:hypothetical protein Avbf_09707 [Armadillidium vulgare]